MPITDDSRPTGTIAVRLNAEETVTLLDIVALAHARASASGRYQDATHLAAITRKLDSLGPCPTGVTVYAAPPPTTTEGRP
ncbi:hypothetical protein Ssi03_62410 [Sphaerisporangium siamense]|uniref:Uncharacterized protein n=1 Tax=Sphaerisporangium siamense TaxID=795645 RepID=A0A7W7GD21_9ACTN|nr:hypothetical protein [Sphaerisporangium siamense]MBB4702551.1 hypothetical protein [Sphaerisporangium siamense]GII88251.1 hypothetical protein Ssi03_62410 [Sphaerisporangium siamense]